MQGRASRAAVEDIETVLGRFQAWSGSRESKAAKDGVREISYEEALESSRYRWNKDADHVPASPKDGGRKAQPEKAPVAPPAASQRPDADSADAIAQRTSALSVEPSHAAASSLPAVPRNGKPRRKQHFRTVLAHSPDGSSPGISLGDSLARSWIAEERQVSMSLRVAASEQALIKVRAAEAGVSASAYLRQCALEVEILRGQVQQFLAVSTRRTELRDPPRTVPPMEREGWLSRFRRRIRGVASTQISLKASESCDPRPLQRIAP